MNYILEQDFKDILNDTNIEWKRFDNATIVVAGANSFIAQYIILTLLYYNKIKKNNPTKIIALVRNLEKAKKIYREQLSDINFELVENDVTKKFITESKIDYILHLASNANPTAFFKNPIDVIKANTLGTMNLLDLAYQKNVKSFLYFSSGEVNGNIFETVTNVKESDYGKVDPLNVRSCYAESKRMGENICSCYFYRYNVPAKIVRLSHTYGPTIPLNDERVFVSFVKNILNNQNIELNSDGSAKRCFLYLSDAVRAYFKILLDGENANAYNVSNDYEISILELAKKIIQVSENKSLCVNINLSDNTSSSKISHGLLDNSKLKALGWSPKVNEDEGFKRVLEYFNKEVKCQN